MGEENWKDFVGQIKKRNRAAIIITVPYLGNKLYLLFLSAFSCEFISLERIEATTISHSEGISLVVAYPGSMSSGKCCSTYRV